MSAFSASCNGTWSTIPGTVTVSSKPVILPGANVRSTQFRNLRRPVSGRVVVTPVFSVQTDKYEDSSEQKQPKRPSNRQRAGQGRQYVDDRAPRYRRRVSKGQSAPRWRGVGGADVVNPRTGVEDIGSEYFERATGIKKRGEGQGSDLDQPRRNLSGPERRERKERKYLEKLANMALDEDVGEVLQGYVWNQNYEAMTLQKMLKHCIQQQKPRTAARVLQWAQGTLDEPHTHPRGVLRLMPQTTHYTTTIRALILGGELEQARALTAQLGGGIRDGSIELRDVAKGFCSIMWAWSGAGHEGATYESLRADHLPDMMRLLDIVIDIGVHTDPSEREQVERMYDLTMSACMAGSNVNRGLLGFDNGSKKWAKSRKHPGHFKAMLKLYKKMEEEMGPVTNTHIFRTLISACARRADPKRALLLLQTISDRIGPQEVPAVLYSYALQACGKNGNWKAGLQLAKQMEAEGLVVGVDDEAACMEALSKGGLHEKALGLFDKLELRWTNAVTQAAFASKKFASDEARPRDARELELTDYAYQVALSACIAMGDYNRMVQIVRSIDDRSGVPSTRIYNEALAATLVMTAEDAQQVEDPKGPPYGSPGALAARFHLEMNANKVPKNGLTYYRLLHALHDSDMPEQFLEVWSEMDEKWLAHPSLNKSGTNPIFLPYIQCCAKLGQWERAMDVYPQMLKCINDAAYKMQQVRAMYRGLNDVLEAAGESTKETRLAIARDFDQWKMQRAQVESDHMEHLAAIGELTDNEVQSRRRQWNAEKEKKKQPTRTHFVHPWEEVLGAVEPRAAAPEALEAEAAAAQLPEALRAWEGSESPPLEASNQVLQLCAAAGEWEKSLEVFEQLELRGDVPNVTTYNMLIRAMGEGKQYRLATELYYMMQGLESEEEEGEDDVEEGEDEEAAEGLAGAEDGEDDEEDEEEVELAVMEPDCTTYTELLDVYRKSGMVQEAEKLWAEMEQRQTVPDVPLVNVMLATCAASTNARLAIVQKVHAAAEEADIQGDAATYQCLAYAYWRCNQLERARDVLGDMKAVALTFAGYDDVLEGLNVLIQEKNQHLDNLSIS